MKKIYLGLGVLALGGAFIFASCGDSDSKNTITYKKDETSLESYNKLSQNEMQGKVNSFTTIDYKACQVSVDYYLKKDKDVVEKDGTINYVYDMIWSYGTDLETMTLVTYAGYNASFTVLNGLKSEFTSLSTLGYAYESSQWYEAKDGSEYKLVSVLNNKDNKEPQTMYEEISFDNNGYRKEYYRFCEGYGREDEDSDIIYQKEELAIEYSYSGNSDSGSGQQAEFDPIAAVSDDTNLNSYKTTTSSSILSKVASYSSKYNSCSASINRRVKTGTDVEETKGSVNFTKQYGEFNADSNSDQSIATTIEFQTTSFKGFIYEYSKNEMNYGAFDSQTYYEAKDGSSFRYVAILNADDQSQSIKVVIEWDQYGYRKSFNFFSEGYFESDNDLIYQLDDNQITYLYK